MAGARKESEFVMFEAFSKLLEQQKLKPSQVSTSNLRFYSLYDALDLQGSLVGSSVSSDVVYSLA